MIPADAPYQEEEGGTFSANGQHYDLNALLRAVAKQPVLHIEVRKLTWVLEHVGTTHARSRVMQADLTAPILVTLFEGQELVVDGLHRLVKATRALVKIDTLPYRRVSPEQMQAAKVSVAAERLTQRPGYTRW